MSILPPKNKIQLSHFDDRPQGTVVDTIIIHSMFVADSPDCYNPHLCISALDTHRVSAHYLIDRKGQVLQLVPEEKRAWHAGVSKLPVDGRENVNHFSIGIELIGKPDDDFTKIQYNSLAELTGTILSRHTIRYIYGHDHIAPGRKTDPGERFSWLEYHTALQKIVVDSSAKNLLLERLKKLCN